MFLQLSAGDAGDARRIPPPPRDDVCRTLFQDCSISADHLTESVRSFKCLYQSLVDNSQGRCSCIMSVTCLQDGPENESTLIAHICRMPRSIGIMFGTLQRCFVHMCQRCSRQSYTRGHFTVWISLSQRPKTETKRLNFGLRLVLRFTSHRSPSSLTSTAAHR